MPLPLRAGPLKQQAEAVLPSAVPQLGPAAAHTISSTSALAASDKGLLAASTSRYILVCAAGPCVGPAGMWMWAALGARSSLNCNMFESYMCMSGPWIQQDACMAGEVSVRGAAPCGDTRVMVESNQDVMNRHAPNQLPSCLSCTRVQGVHITWQVYVVTAQHIDHAPQLHQQVKQSIGPCQYMCMLWSCMPCARRSHECTQVALPRVHSLPHYQPCNPLVAKPCRVSYDWKHMSQLSQSIILTCNLMSTRQASNNKSLHRQHHQNSGQADCGM